MGSLIAGPEVILIGLCILRAFLSGDESALMFMISYAQGFWLGFIDGFWSVA
jgi:hypothetical protein